MVGQVSKILKILYFSLFFSFIFSKSDSLKLPKIDFSKNLNIPGILNNLPTDENKQFLHDYQIEEIKIRAKKFIPYSLLEDDIAVIETNRGNIKIKLFHETAPNHCYNFKKLANSGFYDKTFFHRIIPQFIIQGGDINTRDGNPDNDGLGNPGWFIDAEFNDISHSRGILSMARSSDINSAGSQFFICINDAPHLDSNYTAFGKVIEGMHIVDFLAKTPTHYIQAKRLSNNIIPDGEDPDNWITFRDPVSNQKLYSKIPKYNNEIDYEYEIKKKINSQDRPSIPLLIKKIRINNEID